MKRKFSILMMMSLAVVACNKEIGGNLFPIEQESDVELAVLSEMTDAIANSGTSTAFGMASMIQQDGDRYETIYPETLSAGVATKSSVALNDALLAEINGNVGAYPHLVAKMGGLTRASDEVSLSSIPVEFYMPNSDKFNVDEEEYITIAHHSLVTEDWTDGYRYSKDGSKEYVARIDEEYLENNMTILVLPLDTTEYTKPLSDEEIREYIASKTPSTKAATIGNGLLRTNITNSESIREQDLLYTTIGGLRASGTSWCGAISNKLKLAIYRVSGDVDFNSDGSLKASATSHKPVLIGISKDDLKSNKWQSGNYLFDDDWDLHEYDQKIYFVSEHNTGKTNVKAEASVGIGYKDGKFSAEMGLKVSVEFEFAKHSIMRVNNQLLRTSMLATNMNDMGCGTHNGYAIRRYGIVDMTFNFYYTKLD
ncbi:MAG: hypothetical protein NC115_06100 [Bacteroidales bacterium]|nr:hypothetical protein [Bacteroidales bacterium]